MFYISPSDNEYDNVFGIFKGDDKTIKFGFSHGNEYEVQEKKEVDFSEPKISIDDYELIDTVNPDPTAKKKQGKGCLVTFTILIIFAIGITIFTYAII